MRKPLIAVLGVLGIGVVFLPYIFGSVARQQYESMVRLGAESARVKVAETTFEKGWFGSRARTILEVPTATGAPLDPTENPVRITLEHDITHGPFAFAERLGGAAGARPILAVIHSRVSPASLPIGLAQQGLEISIETMLPMGGDGTSKVLVPPFQAQSKEGVFAWNGLEAAVRFSLDAHHVAAVVTSAGFEAKGTSTVTVEGLAGEFQYQQNKLGDLPSDSKVTIERVALGDPAQAMRFEKIVLESVNRFAGPLLTSTMKLDIGAANLAGESYGPGVFEIVARNLDSPALRQLRNKAQEIVQNREGNPGLMDLFAALREVLSKLAASSPEIEVTQLSVATKQGALKGQAKVRIDGSNKLLLNHPLLMLSTVEANADLSVPVMLLDATLGRERAQALIEKGVLILEGTAYILKASYKHGQFNLNGKGTAARRTV